MTIAAYLALFGWVPVTVIIFAVLPPQRAVAASVVGAWLLLPPYTIPIEHLPDYSKNTAATVGLMLGTLFFGADRILSFRPRWFDLPMLGWCLCGIASSISNGLGLYDGLSDSLGQVVGWGMPYFFGRLYLRDLDGLREFTIAMVVGGLAYILPCLFEIKMSSILLPGIYGMGGYQDTRWGLQRARVFFSTVLELGMWMTAASLVAWWLWRCGALRKIGRIRFGGGLLAILIATTVFCRSLGAVILMAGGMAVLWASSRFKTRLLLWGLVLCGPIYAGVRIPKLWSGQEAVNWTRALVNDERAQSLGFRFQCEDLLVARAIQQPVFGWGRHDRSRPYAFAFEDDPLHRKVIIDGMWISALGIRGFVGLVLWFLAMELPAMMFLWRFPTRLWRHPRMAPASVAAVLLGLYMIDCLLNGFINIILVTLAGGLIGIVPTQLGAGIAEGSQAGPRGGPYRSRLRGAEISRTASHLTGPTHGDGSRPCHAVLSGSGKVRLADQYYHLGRTLKWQGRLAEAKAAWRYALDILAGLAAVRPDAPDLLRRWCDFANDLAWLELSHPDPTSRDPASAIALARQVVELRSDCGVYWNTLGVAYFRAGDFLSAVEALDRATALGDGGTAFDDIFLAMAHARMGNWERARHWFAEAMVRMEQYRPGHPELAKICDEARSILAAGPEGSTIAC
jgi:hypothetical protein